MSRTKSRRHSARPAGSNFGREVHIMHYVLYRHTHAYGANATAGFFKFFTPQVSEARSVLAPELAADPLADGVRGFPSAERAVKFLEAMSVAVMTPRSKDGDPFLGWTPMAVMDEGDCRFRLESEGLKEA